MLKISLTPGEYFTVGDDVVIQLYRAGNGRSYLAIDAPREVSIVRGTVLEREGGRRPDRLMAVPPKGPKSPLL